MSAYSDLILGEASLQSYWRLDEPSGNAVDSGPGAVAGTVNASVTRSQPSLLGSDSNNSMAFSGASNVNINFGDVYDFAGVATYSVELWVNVTANATITHRVMSKRTAGASGWDIRYDGNTRFHSQRSDSGGVADSANGPTVSNIVGFRQHLVVTYDASTILVYTNGVAGTGVASTRSITDHAANLCLGTDSVGSNGAVAVIDEVAIYNTALSAAAVYSHYEEGSLDASGFSTRTGGVVLVAP